MSEQTVHIGKKIMELGSTVFHQSQYPINKDVLPSVPDFFLPAKENLFFHVGRYFLYQKEENIKELIAFVEEFGRELLHSRVGIDRSVQFIYLTRCSIMEMLELEFRENRIDTDAFFDYLKMLEYVYQLISGTLLKSYNQELSLVKFALDESNEDLKMTNQELEALRKALNEATIFTITDQDDRISYANDKFCRLFNYSREELIGKKHDIFCSGYHPPNFFKEIWKTLQRGEVWNGEILNQTRDGRKIWLDTTLVPFVDWNGKHFQHIAIQYDITERKKNEETLLKTEKLSMIGELAAGIAHEIRNPLTTIRGFVQLLTESGNGYRYADTLLDEIERINYIVNEFMIFARPHTVDFRPCDVKKILGEVIRFLEPEALLKNVMIEFHYPPEEVVLDGERNQLKQVFLNLIKNSIEAMPEGGRIYISIETAREDIFIKFRDEGAGMEEEQLKRLGEPFFTTKAGGNGLGLMVSYKIIQNHQGTIDVQSIPNKGTCFTLAFKRKQQS